MAGEIFLNNITGKFDWGSIVEQIIRAKSLPLQRLSQEAQKLQQKQEAIQELSSSVQDLSRLFETLNMEDLFKGKKATSSDTSVLTAVARQSTPNVTLNITVERLSQKESLITQQGLSDIDQPISWSDFQITYNTGSSTLTYNISAGSGKLQDLVNAINNSAGDKVVASVFYDGSNYRLMLSERSESASTAETSGGSTVISMSGLQVSGNSWSLDTANPLQEARNAKLRIGTNTVTSPTNQFEGIVSGLTLEVKKEGSATVAISEDYSKAGSFLSDFVKRYNAVISQVNKLTAKDALFQGDYGVAGIKSELSRMLDKLFAEDLVNIKEDGTLEVNTSAVNSLADSNPNRLREIITDLKNKMGSYAMRTSTNLQNSSNDYQSRIDQIKQRAEVLGEQLLREEERLKIEYAKVEAFINRAQEVMGRLQAFMVSLSEANNKK